MKPEASLPHSRYPATCPYPEEERSVHNLTSRFLKIHLNIIFLPRPGSSKWSLSLRFLHPKPVYTFTTPHTCHISVHFIRFDCINLTILGEEYRSLSYSLCNFLHSPITSPLLGRNILLNTLFSNTLRLGFSLNMNDKFSHPYKTAGKIIVLCILTFIFLDSKLEDRRFSTEC